MFYSQTFLARKGPLGTVWCAAHLQHRLKKSHYTSTDISSTVDRIMFPEVPIALRMSGHLLLGVVRIYSKKVDYLFHDCNVVLIGLSKAFPTTEVNLPENATMAKFESVTLPPTFDLDALDVGNDLYAEGSPDNHLRSQEEITLTDQIPIGRDPYVAISFDEDIMMDIEPSEQDPISGDRPMQGVLPSLSVDHDAGFENIGPNVQTELVNGTDSFQNPGPSNQTQVLTENLDSQDPGRSNQSELLTENLDSQDPGPSNQAEDINSKASGNNSPPEIEVMRSAVHEFGSEILPPVLPDCQTDATEPNIFPDHVLNDKEILSPIMEDTLPSGGMSLPFQQHSEPPTSAASKEGLDIFDTLGHTSPALAIRSTPPVRHPQPRQRKRKHFFDKTTVLTNKFMKKALEDSGDLLRKKRDIPSSTLGMWKLTNSLRKEQIYYEPSITGLCADLCNIYKEEYISAKPHLTLEREATPECMAERSAPETEAMLESSNTNAPTIEAILEPTGAQLHAAEPEINMEIECLQHNEAHHGNDILPELVPPATEHGINAEMEHLRHNEGHHGNDVLPELLTSPAMHSPFRIVEQTCQSASSLGSEIPQERSTTGTGLLFTPDIAMSTGTCGSELETPGILLEEQFGVENTALSDIPESMNTDAGDLYFLEADNTPAGSQGTQGMDSLSVRTRAVAQYLKRHSPIAPKSEDPSRDLSLNKILQGRTRKLCARMFFETLILKNYGLIEVQQEQPYGDIILKLTPTLSKAQL